MKLLQKTIRGYLLYSIFTLVVAIPIFYFTIQNVLRHQADEELLSTKESLKARLEAEFEKAGLHEIKFLDSGIQIVPAANEFKDSLFTINEYDSAEEEMIPYRVIRSNILLNGHPYLLTRKISLLENDDLIKTILNVQVTLLVLLLAGLFIINRRLSIRIWKPFYRTLEKLKKFNVEKDSRLGLAKSGINEFDDLNHSLEGFAERTHQAFVSQKEFAENASHELQTPLAIMQGKLELLMQTPDLSEEQANLIDELADAGRRMSHLNKNLILLTKIENNLFHELEKISLRSVIENFTDTLYRPAIEQKLIELNTDFQEDILLTGNRSLIEIFTGNLLGNAIRYNPVKGKINISMRANMLIITNSGQTQPLDPGKIFNRFQKEGTNSDSPGLGLEIARKIAGLYAAELSYEYENGLHLFITVFPTADHFVK